ncbi:MAG: hypothetical protein FJ318_04905 [SAR202 cluster bacterium]|nr:hypothetical protein [SAR202 cluster bacterium]
MLQELGILLAAQVGAEDERGGSAPAQALFYSQLAEARLAEACAERGGREPSDVEHARQLRDEAQRLLAEARVMHAAAEREREDAHEMMERAVAMRVEAEQFAARARSQAEAVAPEQAGPPEDAATAPAGSAPQQVRVTHRSLTPTNVLRQVEALGDRFAIAPAEGEIARATRGVAH